MISLTIDTGSMTKQDAAALRAIADAYYPIVPAVTGVEVAVALQPGFAAPGTKNVDDKTFAFGHKMPEPTLAEQFKASVEGTAARVGGTAKVIDPADNPAVGAPDQHALADQVFSGGAVPTSEPAITLPGFTLHANGNMEAKNVTFVPAGHGSPELDADAAKLEAMVGAGAAGITELDLRNDCLTGREPDPAQVFSGGVQFATGGVIQGDTIPMYIVGATPSEATAPPNVPSGTPTPPPLPPATLPTLPPPYDGATIGSPTPSQPPAPGQANASAGVPTTSGVQVDKAGLPWDARIHAGTKTMTAKGVWTRRRAIEDSTVVQVEAQLRAAMNIPAMPTPPLGTPGAWPFPKDSSSVGGAATPPPPADAPPTFPTLMTFITERVGAGTLTPAQVTAAVQSTGLESINLAMQRPDLIPAIMAELQKVAP